VSSAARERETIESSKSTVRIGAMKYLMMKSKFLDSRFWFLVDQDHARCVAPLPETRNFRASLDKVHDTLKHLN